MSGEQKDRGGRDRRGDDGGCVVQSDRDEFTGQRIGNLYTIVRRIAKGGFCNVFLADMDNGDRVVIKQIVSDRWEFVAKFQREADIIRGLPHPNIAKVRQLIYDDKNPHTCYQVMDYVEGGTLYDLIYNPNVKFSIWSAAYVISCVVAALGRAHAFNRGGVIHGMYHLDVSPENILIGLYGEVKLTDWGVHFLTRPDVGPLILVGNSYVGKAAYMAPEQIPDPEGGPRKIGPWTDFYSVGLVWAEMFLRRPVFSAAQTTEELITRARRGYNLDLRKAVTDKKLRDLIRETDAIIRQLCHDNPEARPGDAKLILSQIERDIQNYETRGRRELARMAIETFGSRLGLSSAAATPDQIEAIKSTQGWKAPTAFPPLRLTLAETPPTVEAGSPPAVAAPLNAPEPVSTALPVIVPPREHPTAAEPNAAVGPSSAHAEADAPKLPTTSREESAPDVAMDAFQTVKNETDQNWPTAPVPPDLEPTAKNPSAQMPIIELPRPPMPGVVWV